MAVATSPHQGIATLDLEGVLIPEIWIAIAESTGIEELRRTTRDEPNYDALMKSRIQILKQHGLSMSRIEAVIAGLSPTDGAVEFLDALRERTQVIILSDTFEQFGQLFMRQLHYPTLFCHRLIVEDDHIVDFELRQADQKRLAVQALKSLNYRVAAAGDSYNDTAMLAAADVGFLFHSPDHIKKEFPQFPALETFNELLEKLTTAIDS